MAVRGKIPQRQEGHRLQPGPLGSSIQGWDGKDWGTEGVTWEWVMEGPAEELGLSEERGHHCGTLSAPSCVEQERAAGAPIHSLLGSKHRVGLGRPEVSAPIFKKSSEKAADRLWAGTELWQ